MKASKIERGDEMGTFVVPASPSEAAFLDEVVEWLSSGKGVRVMQIKAVDRDGTVKRYYRMRPASSFVEPFANPAAGELVGFAMEARTIMLRFDEPAAMRQWRVGEKLTVQAERLVSAEEQPARPPVEVVRSEVVTMPDRLRVECADPAAFSALMDSGRGPLMVRPLGDNAPAVFVRCTVLRGEFPHCLLRPDLSGVLDSFERFAVWSAEDVGP